MRTLYALVIMIAFGAGLAMADLLGNGSGFSPGPNDPFLFAFSNAAGGTPVDLNVTDANGNSYTFTTSFDEINAGDTNSGWWSPTMSNGNSNSNFIVDQGISNNYFSFDMAQNTVSAAIVSATLSIPTNYGFCTPEPSCETDGLPVTYSVGSVSDSASTLADKNASPNASIYNDLATGNYGSYSVNTIADYTNPVNIALDAAAISDLNAVVDSDAFFSIGGTLSPTSPVPEPSSYWLLLGMVALVVMRHVRRGARA